MMRVECPVCSFMLRGKPTEGYRCVKCHARYSTRFVRRIRRLQFKDVITTHFDTPPLQVSESNIVFEDKDHEIEHSIDNAKTNVETNLEDFLELSHAFPGTELEHLHQGLPQDLLTKPKKPAFSYEPEHTEKRTVRKTTRHRR